MCRTQPQLDDTESRRLAQVALTCFAERGFAGTTVRELACAAEMPVGRLYGHHRTKRALLGEVVSASHDRLLGEAVAALADAPSAPAARLEAVVRALVDFHSRHRRESFLVVGEVEHLDADARARVADSRRLLEGLVADVLRDGVRRGDFEVADPADAARSVLAMAAESATRNSAEGAPATRRAARECCANARHLAGASRPAGGATAVPADAPAFFSAA